jgi:sugar lactone lactonase YvrE
MRPSRALVLSTALIVTALGVAPAAAADRGGPRPAPLTEYALPAGFQPEGIAVDARGQAYLGSLADGDVYRLDLRTGAGEVISEGPGTPSVGVEVDRRGRLFVAGGAAGDARVVDTRTGEVLASYALGGGFVNDVVVTGDAAYFSDSVRPVVHVLPLGPGGRLPAAGEQRPISGDLVYGPGFNANGIETTPDGRGLLVVQSSTGQLFRVDPDTGASTAVDLGGEVLVAGDGLTRDGRTLYAVQNRLNTVAVLRLDADGRRAELQERVTDPRFDVPTTVARYQDALYLPNARFGTPPTPETPYAVIGIPRP